MESESLFALINRAKKALIRVGFTKSTVYDNYLKYWNIMLHDIGNIKDFNELDFSNATLQHYGKDIMNTENCLLTTYHRRLKTKSKELLYFQQTGVFHKLPICCLTKDITVLSNEALEEYLHYSEVEELNKKITIKGKRSRISFFLNKYPLDSLTKENILSYIAYFKDHSKLGARNEMNIVKAFLGFCFENKYIDFEPTRVFPNHRILSTGAIPSVYTEKEIAQALDFYKESKYPCSKRNYAIMMILSYYGLRATDVAELSFKSIDWKNNLITLRTSKTGSIVSFKLKTEVGNSLVDYILTERPQSSSEFIFLLENGNPMSISGRITKIINKAFSASGVNTVGKHYGAHSLRASLATRMLGKNIPMFTISKSLGHQSIKTTMIYTKVDIDKLRLCELEVNDNDV